MRMTTDHISRAPGSGIKEDLIAVFGNDAQADLLVLDGATSVADDDIHTDGAALDLDPYVNPHEGVLREAIAHLGLEGVSDPALRRARLLPMLRARREFRHGASQPDVLCLAPRGPFQARAAALRLPRDAAVLAMTDGFYRLVDSYGLYTIEALARQCRSRGLAALMDELRAFEAARAGGALAVKSADDASALLWTGVGRHASEGNTNEIV